MERHYNVAANGTNVNDFEEFLTDFRNSADNNKLFTVFVPTNIAIQDLRWNVDAVIALQTTRIDILRDFGFFHVFVGDGVFEYDDLRCGRSIQMANNLISRTECKSGRDGQLEKFQVGNDNILGTSGFPIILTSGIFIDTIASNGLIHVVDDVTLRPFAITEAPAPGAVVP